MKNPARFIAAALCTVTALWGAPALGEQPIFDEMPRWNDGWGMQVLQEYRTREFVVAEDQPGAGTRYDEDVHLTHVQGVYTWAKEVRVTLKQPFVLHGVRTVPDGQGRLVRQTDREFAPLTVAVPLKSYFNLDGRSGSWTLAPQLRAPWTGEDDYDVYRNVFGGGLGLGYETETFRYHLGGSASAWYFAQGRPARFSAEVGVGVNIQFLGSSGHLKWKTGVEYRTDESLEIDAGPTLYWKFTDTLHGQLRWRHGFYDQKPEGGSVLGDSFRAGLGVVY